MSPASPLSFLVAACLFSAVASALPPETVLPLPPADAWTVQSDEGTVKVASPEPGIVTLDYELQVRKTYVLGYQRFEQATARVLLLQPLDLGADASRFLFECRGMDRVLNRYGKMQLMPLIRDRNGELFVCEPYAYAHANLGLKTWSLWTTSHLYGGEAGGPTQNVYQTDGSGDGWPDAPLQLAGFELQVRGKQGETLRGQFALGELSAAGMLQPQRPPFLYADSVLDREAGEFTFAAEAATVFQGRPAALVTDTFAYAPDSLLSRKRKLFLPTGPEGHFWAEYLLRGSDGRTRLQRSLTYDVPPGVTSPASRPAPAGGAPCTRPLRLSTSGPVPGVIPSGQPFGVTVELDRALAAGPVEFAWKLRPVAHPNVLAEGRVPLAAGVAGTFVPLPATAERDAYRLEATLLDAAGRPLDTLTYYVGRPTDLTKPYTGRTGRTRLREEVKSDAYFRTTFRPTYELASEDAAFDEFRAYLREATKMARDVTLTLDAARGEILPGVYDFTLFDRYMDAAADYGAGVTVRVLHEDARSLYTWPRLERQLNYDGTEIHHHHYGNYSPHDPVLQALWQNLFRAIHDRYRTHPAFQGYYLMQPAGEAVVMDQPWLGIIAGYSPYARIDFRRYLQKTLGLDLPALNRRWSTSHATWEEVQPPLPDFSLRTEPDLRPQWLDFQRFKVQVNDADWFLHLAENIRGYDRDRVLISYGGRTGSALRHLIDYTHGGGVPERPGNGAEEADWLNNRVGAIQESIHPHRWAESGDPGGKGWLLDWNLYTMFSRAGGGGVNTHIYYYPIAPIASKYGGVFAFDRFQKFKPVQSELQGARLLTSLSRQVSVLQDPLTEYTKHRTVFIHRLGDLRRWFDLIQQTGLDQEPFRPERVKEYRLILPNLLDEVMSRENIDLLAGYVRAGGHLLISARTGLHDDTPGGRPYELLRALGIQPPASPWILTGSEITARPVPGASPLTDGLPPLPFYSLEQQRREARQPREMQDYLQWPYRWLSETDYFGHYAGHPAADGTVLARFDDGGAALSLHRAGAGEVLVFWGTPDYRSPALPELLRRSLAWAGVKDDTAQNPIPLMMEARNDKLGRHYGILWQPLPGTYRQRFPQAPDGRFLVEDLISDQRIAIVEGRTLREQGLDLTFVLGASPLKVLRLSKDIPDLAIRALAPPTP